MRITTLNEASGSPYTTKEHLAELLGCTKVTINTRMKEIEEEVKKGRYGQHAIIRDGGIVSMTVIKCKKKAFKFCKFFDVSWNVIHSYKYVIGVINK